LNDSHSCRIRFKGGRVIWKSNGSVTHTQASRIHSDVKQVFCTRITILTKQPTLLHKQAEEQHKTDILFDTPP
jgi:hypothetical protein